MTFTDEQLQALKAKLDRAHISTRKQSGRELSYIEGWWAISEANRIFGFDAWHRETVDLQETSRDLVNVPGYGSKPAYDQWRVSYIARVRITVGSIIREGTGYGSGMAKPEALGDAIESAVKEAETDAMKRALMTFGNPFGLALYDKTQANVEAPNKSSAQLKRDNEWQKMEDQIHADFLDVKTIVGLEQLRADYRKMAKERQWNAAFMGALKDRFDQKEEALIASLNENEMKEDSNGAE